MPFLRSSFRHRGRDSGDASFAVAALAGFVLGGGVRRRGGRNPYAAGRRGVQPQRHRLRRLGAGRQGDGLMRLLQGGADGQFLRVRRCGAAGRAAAAGRRPAGVHRRQAGHLAQAGGGGGAVAGKPVAAVVGVVARGQRHQPEIQLTVQRGVRVEVDALGQSIAIARRASPAPPARQCRPPAPAAAAAPCAAPTVLRTVKPGRRPWREKHRRLALDVGQRHCRLRMAAIGGAADQPVPPAANPVFHRSAPELGVDHRAQGGQGVWLSLSGSASATFAGAPRRHAAGHQPGGVHQQPGAGAFVQIVAAQLAQLSAQPHQPPASSASTPPSWRTTSHSTSGRGKSKLSATKTLAGGGFQGFSAHADNRGCTTPPA